MPELPEVETVVRDLRPLITGATIVDATTQWARTLRGITPEMFADGVAGRRIEGVSRRGKNMLIDLGDDVFTRGRPHPMIDHRLRNERLLVEAADPEVAVILMDVVLGYGAHPDPAGEMVPAIRKAQDLARKQRRVLALVGFVCGTDEDPQGLARQEAALREAGMLLESSNARAARLAARLVA